MLSVEYTSERVPVDHGGDNVDQDEVLDGDLTGRLSGTSAAGQPG